MRILGVDPGEKNIGIAISDPTSTIANPLTVIKHASREKDAAAIVQLAEEGGVRMVIIGQNLDDEGTPTYQGRRAARLGGAIRAITTIPVEFWDESGSTQSARRARIEMEVPQHKRRGHLDELAATIILQSYLDSRARDQ